MRARMTHSCGKLVTGLVVFMAAVIFTATAASAATQSARGYTQKTSNGGCSFIDTSITANAGRITLSTYGSLDWFNGRPCGYESTAPAGWFYVTQDLYVQRGGHMVICNQGPLVFNSAPPGGYSHEVRTSFTWASAPCGSGYYAGSAGSFHYEQGRGEWLGGWRSSRSVQA